MDLEGITQQEHGGRVLPAASRVMDAMSAKIHLVDGGFLEQGTEVMMEVLGAVTMLLSKYPDIPYTTANCGRISGIVFLDW